MMLAQLLGLYFMIVGVIVLYRRKAIMPAVSELARNKGLVLAIAVVELLAGLAIVITYPAVTFDWMGIISVIGWMLMVESILYLSLPSKKVQKWIRRFNTRSWYGAGGAISIVAGAYLAGVGFGFF
jgi:hypothetical protein